MCTAAACNGGDVQHAYPPSQNSDGRINASDNVQWGRREGEVFPSDMALCKDSLFEF